MNRTKRKAASTERMKIIWKNTKFHTRYQIKKNITEWLVYLTRCIYTMTYNVHILYIKLWILQLKEDRLYITITAIFYITISARMLYIPANRPTVRLTNTLVDRPMDWLTHTHTPRVIYVCETNTVAHKTIATGLCEQQFSHCLLSYLHNSILFRVLSDPQSVRCTIYRAECRGTN